MVRSPQVADLVDVLRREGAAVEALEPGVVSVTGLDAQRIGDLAFEGSIRLHELSNRVATLEEAFLEATADAEEYQAHAVRGRGTAHDRRAAPTSGPGSGPSARPTGSP